MVPTQGKGAVSGGEGVNTHFMWLDPALPWVGNWVSLLGRSFSLYKMDLLQLLKETRKVLGPWHPWVQAVAS